MAKSNLTMDEILANAKHVSFLKPEENNGIPTVFITFEDFKIAYLLYPEVMRVNKEKEQYFSFTKSGSKLRLSFILKNENRSHATMTVDYDEKRFEEFMKIVKPTERYLVLFGQYSSEMDRQIASPLDGESFLMFEGYKY
jgi:hypothetical protein